MSASRTAFLLAFAAGTPSFAWAGSCPSRVDAEALQRHLDAAQEAVFSTGDQTQFVSAMEAIEASIPCLDARLSSEQIAELHLAFALQAMVEGRSGKVVPSLHAAMAASPEFALSATQAPEGGPLREAQTEAQALILSDSVNISAPDCVSVWVDGQEAQARLSERPAFVQLLGPGGELLTSARVQGGEPSPTTSFVCPALVDVRPPPPESSAERGQGRRVALGAGAVGAAGATVGLLVASSEAKREWVALASKVRMDPESVDPAAFEAQERRTNALSAAALGAGVATAGLSAALVLTW